MNQTDGETVAMEVSRASPPTTRSRKRAEVAAAVQASEQSCKRPKEESASMSECVEEEAPPEAHECDCQPVPPAKRKASARRPKNDASPVTKLTVDIRHTFRLIRMKQGLLKKKTSSIPACSRSCQLWALLKKLTMFREMCWDMHNRGDGDPDELAMAIQSLQRMVDRWTQAHKDDSDCFAIELIYMKTVLRTPPANAFALYSKIDAFMMAIEKRKAATGSYEDPQGNYLAEQGECLGLNSRYVVHALIGGGAFCKCWLAWDRVLCKKVCVKLTCSRKHCFEQSRREIKTLRYLNAQHPDVAIVKLLHSFVHTGHQALVFEPLAYDLYLLLKNGSFRGLSLKLVCKFGCQILPTLQVLSASGGINLIHCDLKPENIMVVDRKQTRINIIDFGSSCFGGEHGSTYIQSRFYRAPEVLIGCPYTTQIDMWSFGCILFELYTGRPLFNGKGPEDQLMKITTLLGLPPDAMMEGRKFFAPNSKEGERLEAQPKPLSFQDRFRAIGYACITRRKRGDGVSLTDEIKTDSHGRVTDESLLQFIDLITRCLELDPNQRFTPAKAMRHRFWSIGQCKHSGNNPQNTTDVSSSNPNPQPHPNPSNNNTANNSAAPKEHEDTEEDNDELSDMQLESRDAVSHMTGVQMAMAKATLNQ